MPAQKDLCKQSVACYQGLMRTPILPLIPWLMVPRGSTLKYNSTQICVQEYTNKHIPSVYSNNTYSSPTCFPNNLDRHNLMMYLIKTRICYDYICWQRENSWKFMNMFVNKKNIAPNKKKKKAPVGETLYLLVHSRPLLDCILQLLIVSISNCWIGWIDVLDWFD